MLRAFRVEVERERERSREGRWAIGASEGEISDWAARGGTAHPRAPSSAPSVIRPNAHAAEKPLVCDNGSTLELHCCQRYARFFTDEKAPINSTLEIRIALLCFFLGRDSPLCPWLAVPAPGWCWASSWDCWHRAPAADRFPVESETTCVPQSSNSPHSPRQVAPSVRTLPSPPMSPSAIERG